MNTNLSLLSVPTNQLDNLCYRADRAYEQGYDDGRFFGSKRRPGATRGTDQNYDLGFAVGTLDRLELDDGTFPPYQDLSDN